MSAKVYKKTNHTSLCDTSLCDTSLFYVLLTRSMFIETTCHPCLLDEHHHVYRHIDNVAYSFHIALAESEGAGNGIFRVWHHSRQWKDRKLHISNTFPLIYYTFPTRFAHIPYTFPIFWCFHLLMLSSLQGLDFGIGSHYFHCIFVFLGVMQIYNVKIRLNSQLSV